VLSGSIGQKGATDSGAQELNSWMDKTRDMPVRIKLPVG